MRSENPSFSGLSRASRFPSFPLIVPFLLVIIGFLPLIAESRESPGSSRPGPREGPDARQPDLSDLGPDQKALAEKLFRDRTCDCGCGASIHDCLQGHPDCSRARQQAARIISHIKRGMDERQIVDSLQLPVVDLLQPETTLDPQRKYEIPIEGAPTVGPDDARVTIVHYLDYR